MSGAKTIPSIDAIKEHGFANAMRLLREVLQKSQGKNSPE